MCADAVLTPTAIAATTVAAATRIALIRSIEPASLRLQRGLCAGNAGDRHAIRRAAHVVEPGHVEEGDRGGIAAVLAADAEPEVGLRLAAGPGPEPDEPSDSRLV